jgi:deoxyribose-phosphate aldolase
VNNYDILKRVDHTLLKVDATKEQILSLCDDAIKYKTASVCIPPSFVSEVKKYVNNKMKVCTVIGFPNGYETTDAKCFETYQAVKDGADEIDMVINIGWVKERQYDKILDEIKKVRHFCKVKVLKVIIETCLLTTEEKIKMCEIVSKSGADFIKTSTGFSKEGAKFEDIALFKEHLSKNVKIKAAGGISSMEDAIKFITLGADRLGTSKIVALVKEQEK